MGPSLTGSSPRRWTQIFPSQLVRRLGTTGITGWNSIDSACLRIASVIPLITAPLWPPDLPAPSGSPSSPFKRRSLSSCRMRSVTASGRNGLVRIRSSVPSALVTLIA